MALVVVIDDNVTLRDVICMIVQDDGHTTIALYDGVEVLRTLREGPEAAVVLIDRLMPLLDVEALLTEIAGDPNLATRHAYVLMTASRHDWPESLARLLVQLNMPVLDKPFDMDVLLDLVSQRADLLAARPRC